jgi:hypothetical protein
LCRDWIPTEAGRVVPGPSERDRSRVPPKYKHTEQNLHEPPKSANLASIRAMRAVGSHRGPSEPARSGSCCRPAKQHNPWAAVAMRANAFFPPLPIYYGRMAFAVCRWKISAGELAFKREAFTIFTNLNRRQSRQRSSIPIIARLDVQNVRLAGSNGKA